MRVFLFAFNFSCATKPKLQRTLKPADAEGLKRGEEEAKGCVRKRGGTMSKVFINFGCLIHFACQVPPIVVVCLFKDVCQLSCGSAIKRAALRLRERGKERAE